MIAARILVGSCSWTDPTLIACGRFYPAGVTSAEARLRFYAEQFAIVEVDSTYYAPPIARNASSGRRARRPASSSTSRPSPCSPGTTPRPRTVCPPGCGTGCRTRRAANAPCTRATSATGPGARLAAAPRGAGAARAGRQAGRRALPVPALVRALPREPGLPPPLPERLPGWPLAVEFRGGGWMADEAAAGTLRLLEEAGLTYVAVDEPQGFPNSTPPLAAATAPLAVCASTAATRTRGRAAPAPPRTASSTSTATRSSTSGSPGCASWRRSRCRPRAVQQQLRGLGHAERAPHGAPARR